MAVIDIQVQMAGGSDAKAVPIRQISVSAILRGVGASVPGKRLRQVVPPQSEVEPDRSLLERKKHR